MAKLLLDPEDADARKFMNDDRAPREHYHFAALNWARFLPLFGAILEPRTRETLANQAGSYNDYLNPKGTDNHRTQSLFAANVLPFYLDGGRIAGKERDDALKTAKEQLRAYVKGLYAWGQGEWDSPTYMTFALHGLLNIYDFSKDPETRRIAAAGIDWFVASYALKYRNGIYTGPNQRGYYDRPVSSISDMTGWLWWDAPVPADRLHTFYYAMHPATSSWRPNAVLVDIARKKLPGLPVTQLNSKPNYWYGQQIPAVTNTYPETLHIGKNFTMGSIWRGFGSQITRFQLVADGADGPLALTGGHPRKSDHTGKKLDELTFRDGGGRYDQSAQLDGLYLCISRIPDDESEKYTFVSIPDGVTPEKIGGDWVFRMGEAWVGVIPFTKSSELLDAGIATPKAPRILRFPGAPSGFAIVAADAGRFAGIEDFSKWMKSEYRFDLSRFDRGLEVGIHHHSRELGVAWDPKNNGIARARGFPIPQADKIFSGPFVSLESSVLSVSNGGTGYEIDFSGDLPIYRNLPAR